MRWVTLFYNTKKKETFYIHEWSSRQAAINNSQWGSRPYWIKLRTVRIKGGLNIRCYTGMGDSWPYRYTIVKYVD